MGSGPKDVTVRSGEPGTGPEKVANAVLEALKAQLGEGFEFIVIVMEDRGQFGIGETRYSTGAAVEDPDLIPMHLWRALQTLADPDTLAKLRAIMTDA